MADKPKAPELAKDAPDGSIPVVAPDGSVSYLPKALASDPAALEGMRRATDKELRGAQVEANKAATKAALDAKFSGSVGAEVEGAVAPALAGAARGLTLGGSDALASQFFGEGARRRLLDYQKYAPISSTVGELGAIGGAALLGDESVLGSLPNAVSRLGLGAERGIASALGKGALARGAGILARGAVEGAAYGAGSALSESALKDTGLTGEALIGGMAHGALGGAVASGLLHGAGAGVGKLADVIKRPKVSPGAFEAVAGREFGEAAPGIGERLAAEGGGPYRAGAAVESAEGGIVDSAGKRYAEAQGKLSPESREVIADAWKKREIALNNGAEALDAHSRDFAKAINEAEQARKATQEASFGQGKLKQMDKLVDSTKFDDQAVLAQDWIFRANDVVNEMTGDVNSGFSNLSRKKFDGHVDRIAKAIESGESTKLFEALDNAKRFVGDEAKFGRGKNDLSEAGRQFDALYHDDAGIQKLLENEAWGKAGEAQASVNAPTARNIAFGERFRKKFTTEHGAEMGRPEYVANTEAVSSFMNKLTKAGNDLDAQSVRDMISTRRAFLDATETHYDHDAKTLKAIASERAALDKMEATFDKATKDVALINQVKRLQGEEQAQGIGGLVGLATDAFTKPITTMRRIASLEEHTQNILGRISNGTRELIGGTSAAGAVPTGLRPPKGDGEGFFTKLLGATKTAGEAVSQGARAGGAQVGRYARESRQISALQANPQALVARVGGALDAAGADAPKVTAAATEAAMRGLAFLASKMPPSRQDPYSLQPQFQPTTQASDAEVASFNRYREALDDPTIVLTKAKDGSLTPEHVEAVKEVYPKLYEQMRVSVMNDLVSSKSPIPYGKRLQLGILLDLPTDATLDPDFIRAIQATYTASEQAGQEPPPPNLSQLDVASSLATGTQVAASEGKVR